mgnify:CR=1 FL=1
MGTHTTRRHRRGGLRRRTASSSSNHLNVQCKAGSAVRCEVCAHIRSHVVWPAPGPRTHWSCGFSIVRPLVVFFRVSSVDSSHFASCNVTSACQGLGAVGLRWLAKRPFLKEKKFAPQVERKFVTTSTVSTMDDRDDGNGRYPPGSPYFHQPWDSPDEREYCLLAMCACMRACVLACVRACVLGG